MIADKPKSALICGVGGQDGAYLAKLLLEKGYVVHGTSRDAAMSRFVNLETLGIKARVNKLSMSLTDFRSVAQVLAHVCPDEIYNLAGQSSVSLSFEQPVETLESIAVGTLNILEAVRFLQLSSRIYNACSSECFGDTKGDAADEDTPFRPRSPYAVAKATAHWEVVNYREAYSLYACSGILFNHESPLRPERFVTQKVVAAACRIAERKQERLQLGNIKVQRDWGWAPEFVEAMWRMLQQDVPQDYVIATGETQPLEKFVSLAFEAVGLRWDNYVVSDPGLMRTTDLVISRANPAKASSILHWQACKKLPDIVDGMIAAELSSMP